MIYREDAKTAKKDEELNFWKANISFAVLRELRVFAVKISFVGDLIG